MSSEGGVRPNFLMIGPGRTGSSWMYEMLLEHPEVCMAKNTKETLFFEREYSKGWDWYLGFFDHCREGNAIGEISTVYFHREAVPERIGEHFTRIRLLACLREPMDRLLSAYAYRRRSGETTRSLEEALEKEPDLLEESLYDKQLKRFLEHFPQEDLRILFYEDLQRDPRSFLKQLYEAIGVDPEFVPEGVDEKVNPRSRERIPGLGRILGFGATTLRKIGAFSVLDRIKRNEKFKSLFLKEEEKPAPPTLSEGTEKELRRRFEEVREWVEKFTGRSLDEWKQH